MEIPVLLPKIFNYPLTYTTKLKKLKTGDLVKVPFGNSEEIGVVWDKKQTITKKIRLKEILCDFPEIRLEINLIKFINWFSTYNIVSKGLVLKMCLGKNFQSIKKNNLFNQKVFQKNSFKFNSSQKKVLRNLSLFDKNFSATVLQGVTGSGKTLIYFEKIKEILNKKKQVLILLPEIFLTNQFEKRFQDFFGFAPAIWHSRVTPKNRKIIWQGVLKKDIQIVIGARSSLFLPFKDLGFIVVDEEHDQSYKQDEGIIYNARDMAVARASIESIPILLVSSIPSLETFKNIKNKKYNHIVLKKRFKNFPLPKTKIINMDIKKSKKNLISDEALKIVKNYLKNKNQVLFFLNRRGYSNFLICKNCGFKHVCPNCSIYLTYHNLQKKVICHYCGYSKDLNRKCFKEKKCDFSKYGIGVEKVFEELRNKFPQKKIEIFSSDYLSNKNYSANLIKDIENDKVDILVGTQMISKGFNFPKLNCIIVVDADFTGYSYDLRTSEKNIQLYNQLSGRAGRFSSNSMIVYQTLAPEHKILDDIINNKVEIFLENELMIRKQNNLPPFKKLIALIITSKKKDICFNGAIEIKKELFKKIKSQILGPVEAPISRIKKNFRSRLLIKTENNLITQKLILNALQNLKISRKIKLRVDVDPINFA